MEYKKYAIGFVLGVILTYLTTLIPTADKVQDCKELVVKSTLIDIYNKVKKEK